VTTLKKEKESRHLISNAADQVLPSESTIVHTQRSFVIKYEISNGENSPALVTASGQPRAISLAKRKPSRLRGKRAFLRDKQTIHRVELTDFPFADLHKMLRRTQIFLHWGPRAFGDRTPRCGSQKNN
jgi:hypothetical protein